MKKHIKYFFYTSLCFVCLEQNGFSAGCPDIPVGGIICKDPAPILPGEDPSSFSIKNALGSDQKMHAVFPGVVNQIWAVPAGKHWYNFGEKPKCRPCLDSSNPNNKEKTKCGSPFDRAQEFCAPYGGIDSINTPVYWGDSLINAGSTLLKVAGALDPRVAAAQRVATVGLSQVRNMAGQPKNISRSDLSEEQIQRLSQNIAGGNNSGVISDNPLEPQEIRVAQNNDNSKTLQVNSLEEEASGGHKFSPQNNSDVGEDTTNFPQ